MIADKLKELWDQIKPQSDPDNPEEYKEFHRGKVIGAGITVLLLVIITFALFTCGKPRQGSILYGICNTFLEQNVPYPESVFRTAVEQYPRVVRIFYNQIDPFGQHRLEMMECVFTRDDNQNIIFETVIHNREEIAQEKIDKFNPTIPAVVAAEPNLDLPAPRRNMVQQLR